jgi:hypothetical protein
MNESENMEFIARETLVRRPIFVEECTALY